MALSAINEISVENNYLSDLLKTYQQDILAKESVQFFRGKHIAKELEKIDKQVGDLLSLLCLELIEKQNTAKIIEYLLRIYEPHKHYPKALFFSILPLHETVWFSKITQLLTIEQQGELADIFFVKQLAYKGERPPFTLILEATLRNHASLFSQYSKWYFERFNHVQYDSYNFQVSSTLDTRFFSYLLIASLETLEQRQDESESQIQSILPFISQCFSKALVSSNGQKLTQTDMLSARQKILLRTGIFSLSILSGFRKLTNNFKEAFVQQLASVCNWSLSVTLQPEIEIFEKALLVIVQFNLQKPFIGQAADLPFLIFTNQNGVKSLIKLAEKHDLSYFIPKILVTILQQDESLIQKLVDKLKNCLNLKTVQQIILALISGHFGSITTSSTALQLRNHLRSFNSLRLVYYQAASLIIQNLRSKAIDAQSKDQAINLLLDFCIFDQKGSNEQIDFKAITAVQEQIIRGVCQTQKLQVRRQSFINLLGMGELHLFTKILLLSQVEEMNAEEAGVMKQIDFKISKKTRRESIALSDIGAGDDSKMQVQKLPLKERKDSFCEPEFKISPEDFLKNINDFLNKNKVNSQDLQNLDRFLHKSLSTLFENDEKSEESDLLNIFEVCYKLLKNLSVESAQQLNESSILIILSSITFYTIQIINTISDLLPKSKTTSLNIEKNKNLKSQTEEILNCLLKECLQKYIMINKQKVEALVKKTKQIEDNPFDRFIAEMDSDEEMQEDVIDADTYSQTVSLILDMISSLLILFTKLDIQSAVKYFSQILIPLLTTNAQVQSECLVQEFKLSKSKKILKSILEQNELALSRQIFIQMLETNEEYILELLLCQQESEKLLLQNESAFLITNLCRNNNQSLLNQIFRLYLSKVQDLSLIGELLVIANLIGQPLQADISDKVDIQKLNLITEQVQAKDSNLQLAILNQVNIYLDPQSSIFFDQLSNIAHEDVDQTQNTLQVCQMALLQLREMALPLRDGSKVYSHILNQVSQVGNHLHEMTSTQLQIAIVLNLIDNNSWQYFLDNKQQLRQLSEAMGTLLDKTAVFWGQMSEGQQQHRSKEYQELIEVLLQNFILQFQINVFKGKKQMVLVRAFLCQTFNLFRKISCSFSSRNWLSSSLQLGFQLLNDSVLLSDNLMQAEILLCVTHIQEVCLVGNSVKGVKVYEHIPNLIQCLLTQLTHILANITSEPIDKVDGFMSQRVMAILQSLLSLYTFSHQFINSEQHHNFLHNTLLLTDLLNHSNEQVYLAKQVLEQMIQCSFVSSGAVSVLRTIMNIYSEVFVSVGAKQNDLKSLGKVWRLYTQSILNKTFISGSQIANESHSKLQVALIEENHESISTFIVKMAGLPKLFFKYQKTDMANLNNFEQDLVNFINDYCLKLKPDQLSGLIHQLSKWAFKGVISSKEIARNENEEQYDLHKQVIFYKILSGIVSQLKEFSIPYVIKYYSQLISVLKQTIDEFSKASQKHGKKRAKVEIDTQKPLINSLNIDGTGHTLYKLICEILKHLEIVFTNDTQTLLQIDNYEQLVDEAQLCEVFTLVGFIQEVGKINDFTTKVLNPLFYEMINRSDNASWWNILNREILMKTRQSYPPIVRKTCLQIVLYLFERLSERYLVVLNDSLQFMSESLEDGDEGVEIAAKQLVARIEGLTGESIQAYLK